MREALALSFSILVLVGSLFALVPPTAADPLPAWRSTSSLTVPRAYFGLVRWHNYLYAIGGVTNFYGPDNKYVFLDSVERAPIKPDGSLGPWQVISYMTQTRANMGVAIGGDYIYLIEGASWSCQSLDYGMLCDTLERGHINPDGSVGDWQVISHFAHYEDLYALAYQGNLYYLGGYSYGVSNQPQVYRFPINSDGSLGPLNVISSLKVARYALGVAT